VQDVSRPNFGWSVRPAHYFFQAVSTTIRRPGSLERHWIYWFKKGASLLLRRDQSLS
jgi:hypothetical protein